MGKVNATKKGTAIDLADFIGKQVKLDAVVKEATGKGAEMFISRVIGVTRIEEDKGAAAKPSGKP